MFRRFFLLGSFALVCAILAAAYFRPSAAWALLFFGPLIALGVRDCVQVRSSVLRNFPLIGRLRYVFESIRPEIQQYFIETNTAGEPIPREVRSVAYQRAKNQLETVAFGTQRDVYQIGYEWASQSLGAVEPPEIAPRRLIGGADCSQPYESSMLNISAMSYGSLSKNAIQALNGGARIGGFAHNTGEGGISPYHLEPGGDLIWQVGTGYFGCRDAKGEFDPKRFQDRAALDTVKMIELKLSQGAKPGHGGILPGDKVTTEVAEIRGVEAGKTVLSPPAHSAFSTPRGLVQFIATLRELAMGKPVGFKLAIGHRSDFFAICKAIASEGVSPDFISIDGGEGGTGAAPLEFANSMGMPMRDALIFAHSALRGSGIRDEISLVASGKIITGFDMIRALALGADLCATARGMMLALGCIQALRCNANVCPTGVATQDPLLVAGLNVPDKTQRVANYHEGTIHSFLELLAAMGLRHPQDLRPHHIYRRLDDLQVGTFAELYDFLEPGELLNGGDVPKEYRAEWDLSDPDRWIAEPRA